MAAVRSGFRRLFSISAFTPPTPAAASPPAEPSTNLFVSGEALVYPFLSCSFMSSLLRLSKRTASEGLREAFSKFGQVVYARVVTDRISGFSKGFGFVRYATLEEAAEGIKGMDGKNVDHCYIWLQFLDGWVIFAEYARPKPPPSGPTQPQTPPPQTSEPSSGS
ncbi:hypothetical protein BHM03_00000734 [Ensete ventricosum]|nr:hypothetical protein BHM03_00000734 [Ensete ventricosum]